MQLAQAEATNYMVNYRQPVIIGERRITAQLTKCDGDWLEFELMECKTTKRRVVVEKRQGRVDIAGGLIRCLA